jgi:hypothetical protein
VRMSLTIKGTDKVAQIEQAIASMKANLKLNW